MINLKTIRNLIFVAAIVVLSLGLGYNLGKRETNPALGSYATFTPSEQTIKQSNNNNENLDFTLFWKVWEMLKLTYFDKTKLDPTQMYYGAISGMVSALGDPYTTFLTPDQNKDSKEELGGLFEGIGAQLGFKDKRIVVVAPLKDTPAEKAGLKAGDWIVKIGDKETTNMTLPEAVNLIRGPKGSKIKLTILHEKATKTQEIEVTRDTIFVKSVKISYKDNVAVIKLSRFGDSTNEEWDQIVTEIVSKGGGVRGVVLDLRNNPGGYLTGSVYIASEFIKSGPIVIQEDGSGKKQNYGVNRQGRLLSMPVVVLINQGSASASEIVAGALVDYGRAKTVGEKSFGKGTIQDAQDLENGAGLHVTVAKWLTPKGRWINGTGMTPDYPVTMNEADQTQDPQLDKAIELLK